MGPYIPKGNRRGKNKKVKIEDTFIKNLSMVAVFFIGVLLAGMLALKLYLISLPPIKNLNSLKPNIVTTFCASNGEVIKTFAAYTFSNVELREVPKQLTQALIATEDKNFYRHPGYDIVGLVRSMVANVLAGRVVQGASTLTQQLSRILFLSNEKTFTRKIKELQVSADWILDPVFMLNKDKFVELSRKSKKNYKGKIVSYYRI